LGSIRFRNYLKKLAEGIPDVLAGEAKAQETEPPGFWEVLSYFAVRTWVADLAVVNNLLEALG